MKFGILLYPLIALVSIPAQAKLGNSKTPTWVASVMQLPSEPLSQKTIAIRLYSKTHITAQGEFMVIRSQVIYKIIKTSGLAFGELTIISNANSQVQGIHGWRFDKDWRLLETLDKDRIKRRAYNLSFYDDSEQVFATFNNVAKGDFVAFEYKQKLKWFFKDFSIKFGGKIDTLHQEITVEGNGKVMICNDSNQLVTKQGNTYSVRNMVRLISESNAGPAVNRLPQILITYDVEKNNSWKSFGNDYIEQTKFALALNEKTVVELSNLLAEKDNKTFILNTIKEVSGEINYVDIEFGSGGYIPRECNFVHSKKYGDCKDMAYYAVAILRQRGIKAFPVLSRTKDAGNIHSEFVSDQFNHVIMAVALTEETKDLKNIDIDGAPFLISDLTDRFTKPPLLSSALEGTYGLVLQQSASRLVKIPFSDASKNVLSYDINIHFDFEKKMIVQLTETNTGHFYTSETLFLEATNKGNRKGKYENWIQNFATAAILNSYETQIGDDKSIVKVSFTSPNTGVETGEDIYFFPNLVDKGKKSFKKPPRTSALVFKQLYTKNVNIHITIADNFAVKTLPKPIVIDNTFFKANVTCDQRGNKIDFTSNLVWKVTTIEPADYNSFRKSYKKLLKSLKSPIVLTYSYK